MESQNVFNAQEYFMRLASENRLAAEHGFHACYCSGPDHIPDLMQGFRKWRNFIMVDDTTDRSTFSRGVTYFDNNIYTVFILAGFRSEDAADRKEKMDLCRRIFRQMHSRMIHDRENRTYGDQMEYLDLRTVMSKELPGVAFNGVTGLYFTVANTEPVDLTYDRNEWRG